MNEMNIKVMMPKVELQENELSIVLDVAVKTGHALSIALNSICFINRFGETFEYQNKEEKYYKALTEGCRIRKTINLGNKKQSLTNSQLILCFVDITADRIYTLHYSRSNDAWKIDNSAVVGFGGRKQYRNPIENIEIFHAKPVAKLRMHDNTEEKKYDIDHFIPWSFVMNDELWNLMPMDSSLNSAKNNRLPDWNDFFIRFAKNQYIMYEMIHEREGIRKLYEACYKDNLHSIWANKELYRKGNSDTEFYGILEKNMRPVYDSARRQGYDVWDKRLAV